MFQVTDKLLQNKISYTRVTSLDKDTCLITLDNKHMEIARIELVFKILGVYFLSKEGIQETNVIVRV